MATTRTSSAGKVSFGSWESEEREHPQGCSFFCALSSARRFCSPKGLLFYFSRTVRECALRGIFSFSKENSSFFAQVRMSMRHKCRVMRPPFSFPRKKTDVARPKERRFPLQASSSKSCNACRLHCPVRGVAAVGVAAVGVAIRFDLLLSSAVAQPLAALLPYGCGTPLAGAALPIL